MTKIWGALWLVQRKTHHSVFFLPSIANPLFQNAQAQSLGSSQHFNSHCPYTQGGLKQLNFLLIALLTSHMSRAKWLTTNFGLSCPRYVFNWFKSRKTLTCIFYEGKLLTLENREKNLKDLLDDRLKDGNENYPTSPSSLRKCPWVPHTMQTSLPKQQAPPSQTQPQSLMGQDSCSISLLTEMLRKGREKMLTSTEAPLPHTVFVLAWMFIASYKTINKMPSGNWTRCKQICNALPSCF